MNRYWRTDKDSPLFVCQHLGGGGSSLCAGGRERGAYLHLETPTASCCSKIRFPFYIISIFLAHTYIVSISLEGLRFDFCIRYHMKEQSRSPRPFEWLRFDFCMEFYIKEQSRSLRPLEGLRFDFCILHERAIQITKAPRMTTFWLLYRILYKTAIENKGYLLTTSTTYYISVV